MSIIGLVDKLYWRQVNGVGQYHCFRKVSQKCYLSLCGHHMLRASGGQGCHRPNAWLRCARCDVAEIKRRGKDESLPESKER